MTDRLSTGAGFFQAGGTLPLETPSYVRRKADDELLERVQAGEYCYLLTARQAGKSSLMVCAAERLRMDGVAVAMIDLTVIGQEATDADQWYFGFVHELGRQLDVEQDIRSWWDGQARLPLAQRLVGFLRDVVLAQIDARVVSFIDEIDSTISLKFTDDFFAAIRSCFNARATEPVFRRLTFVLLGVASPTDLIADPTRTPFNIGCAIALTDFTWDEASALLPGLSDEPSGAERTLHRILHWTGGQPYLTQRLCVLCTPATGEPEQVDTVVAGEFLQPGLHKSETNLRSVGERVTASGKPTSRMLRLYRRVLRGAEVLDLPQSQTHNELKLSGLVKAAPSGRLRVRNRLYATVFNRHWIRMETPADWRLRAATATVVLLLLFSPAFYYEVVFPRQLVVTLEQTVAVDPADFQVARDNRDQLRSLWPYLYANKADERWGDLCRRRFNAVMQRDETPDLQREAYSLAQETFSELVDLEDRRSDFPKTAHELLAQFYEQRAMRAEFAEPRDHAIVWRLKTLTAVTSDENRRAVNQFVEPDYPCLHRTFRHGARILAVAFSPDGQTVLTGSEDNTARLWNAATGTPLGEPLRHDRDVRVVTFSPDGQTVFTGSDDKTARLWKTATGAPPREPLLHDGSVTAATFSPNRQTVLTGSEDKTARLWNAATGTPLGEPLWHDGCVGAVTFSPDGQRICYFMKTPTPNRTNKIRVPATNRACRTRLRLVRCQQCGHLFAVEGMSSPHFWQLI